jgi:hypothetical protein
MKHSFGSLPHVLDLVTILRLGLQHLIFDDIVVHHFDVHLMKHDVIHTFFFLNDLFVDLLNDFSSLCCEIFKVPWKGQTTLLMKLAWMMKGEMYALPLNHNISHNMKLHV